ncbi:hypothetical protein ACX801_23365 [Arthrobacter bambusae]
MMSAGCSLLTGSQTRTLVVTLRLRDGDLRGTDKTGDSVDVQPTKSVVNFGAVDL